MSAVLPYLEITPQRPQWLAEAKGFEPPSCRNRVLPIPYTRRAFPRFSAEHRHTAAHRLRPHRLVAAAHELLAICVGLSLDGAPLKERADPRNDLPLFLGP